MSKKFFTFMGVVNNGLFSVPIPPAHQSGQDPTQPTPRFHHPYVIPRPGVPHQIDTDIIPQDINHQQILSRKFSKTTYMYTRVAQKTAISGTGGSTIQWQRAKESFKAMCDVEFEKIFVFRFLEILSWICIIFHILTQPKNPRNFFKKFKRHFLLTWLH